MEQPKFAGVNFVFDKQGRIEPIARFWYELFRGFCMGEIKNLLGDTPKFEDEKQFVPLQAADMFAWYQRRSALGSLGHKSHQDIWQTFQPLQYSTVLEECHLNKIATELKFHLYKTNV
jgi:hypothetical protein